MADLTQARTRGLVGGAGAKLNAANQFSGKNPAPVSAGGNVKFPRSPGTRKKGPRR